MLADDVADFRGAVRRKSGDGDDAVVGAGGVDDQAWRCRTSCRAGPRVTSMMLDADERDDGVGVEQPAANDLQQPSVNDR